MKYILQHIGARLEFVGVEPGQLHILAQVWLFSVGGSDKDIDWLAICIACNFCYSLLQYGR